MSKNALEEFEKAKSDPLPDISEQPPMPVRRLHNFAYCPRLFYLQWVENLFVENKDTVAGDHFHRNVDKPSFWREELDLDERAKIRSLELESDTLHLRGVVDLIEDKGEGKEIVDYKKGSATRDDEGQKIAKPYDRIQVLAYVLLAQENGIEIDRAAIYYGNDHRKVAVEIDEASFEEVRTLLTNARLTAATNKCPPPLSDDPRCLYCSAYPICLPNESRTWASESKEAAKSTTEKSIRPPRPPGDEGETLIVQDPRARIGKRGGELTVSLQKETVSRQPLEQTNGVYLYGAAQISTQAIQACLQRSIPIAYFSPAGRFLGSTTGLGISGIDARKGQYHAAEDPALRLEVTREIVRAKIHNQRVLLMRNGSVEKSVVNSLARLRDKCAKAGSIETLRGNEGAAAALYFGNFSTMLKGDAGLQFDFDSRNRRPPRDPVNALLSLGYSILAKELTGVCQAVGLDPFLGVFHQPRYGRPALALDLMEEFRPLIADSVAISMLNRGELGPSDFASTSRGTFLKDGGRKQFWGAWFRRMDAEVKHPEFGYRLSYRRMLEVQARQLWRYFRGEATCYHGFTTR